MSPVMTALQRSLAILLVLVAAARAHATPDSEAVFEALLSGGPAKDRIDRIEPLLASTDPQVRGRACIALAILGAPSAPKAARALLTDKATDAVVAGAHCLALSGDKAAVADIAGRLKKADRSLSNDLGVLLTQFKNDPVAAEALAKLIRKEKRSYVTFNVTACVDGWTTPALVDAVVAHAQAAVAAGKTFNDDGVLRMLSSAPGTPRMAAIQSLLEKKGIPDVQSGLDALAPVAGEHRGDEVRVLLEGYLQRGDSAGYRRDGISNALVSFNDPRTLKVWAAGLDSCEDLNCEELLWSAAAFFTPEAEKIIASARTHRDPSAAAAAKVIQQYLSAKDRRALALQLLADPVTTGAGKLNFDAYSARNNLILLAARDPSGLRREDLLSIITTLQAKYSMPWSELTRAYLVRFGSDRQAVVELYLSLGDLNGGSDILNRHLEASPSAEGCAALLVSAVRGRLEPRALLPLVRLRISGGCP
jgi:hypothetical protein